MKVVVKHLDPKVKICLSLRQGIKSAYVPISTIKTKHSTGKKWVKMITKFQKDVKVRSDYTGLVIVKN